MARINTWVCLALCATGGCVVTGCDLSAENSRATVSVDQCVSAWNNGSLSFTLDGRDFAHNPDARPTSEIGLIAPRVRVVGCGVTFDLGGGRVFDTYAAPAEHASDVARGDQFYVGRQDGMGGVMVAAQAQIQPGSASWNACQYPSGKIRLGHCPAESATWKRLDIDKVERPLTLHRFHHEVGFQGRMWWLGAAFNGVPGQPFSNTIVDAPRTYTVARYAVAATDDRAWLATVFTLDTPSISATPCESQWRKLLCGGGGTWPTTIVATLHPASDKTVVITTRYIGSGTATSSRYADTHTRTPLPRALITQMINAVQPVPRTAQYDPSRCTTCP